MMKLNIRQIILLKTLLASSDSLAVHVLAKDIQLSSFVIRNELDRLEYFCDSFGLELKRIPGQGILIYGSLRCKKNCLFALTRISYVRQYTRRQSLILLLCSLAQIRSFVKLESLSCLLKVSSTTVSNILKEFEETDEYKRSGIHFETRKGVGLCLHGDILPLTAFLSSLIVSQLEPESYLYGTIDSLCSNKGFCKDIFELLKLDSSSLTQAQGHFERLGFIQTNISGIRWLHSLLFIHLFFFLKERGESNKITEKDIAPYKRLFNTCYKSTLQGEEFATTFFNWGRSLKNGELLTTREFQEKISIRISSLQHWESLYLLQEVSSLQVRQIENFFGLSIKEILSSWKEKTVDINLHDQHVLLLLFQYVRFNSSTHKLFTALILLPMRDQGIEQLFISYFADLFHGLIVPNFYIQSLFKESKNTGDFILTIGGSLKEVSIPAYILPSWIIGFPRKELAKKELCNIVELFMETYLEGKALAKL